MTTTPVGMRCPECSRQRTRVHTLRSVARRPQVTVALIAINVVAFLAEKGQFTLSGSAYGSVVEEGVVARLEALVSHGVFIGLRAPIATEHQYWRLITAGFLHANILHIGFNMYLLYLLGLMLEPAIGRARFAAIYFTALLAGSFGAMFATVGPTLGASGAIFGLMGAAVVELRSRGLSVAESGIGALIVLNLVLSFTISGISVGAHIGGLVGGLLAGAAIKAADTRRVPILGRRVPALGFLACLLLSAVAVAASLAIAGNTTNGIV
jgi:membrane associated rhomboid family serine protease